MKTVKWYLDGCDEPAQPKPLKDTHYWTNPSGRCGFSHCYSPDSKSLWKLFHKKNSLCIIFGQVSWKSRPNNCYYLLIVLASAFWLLPCSAKVFLNWVLGFFVTFWSMRNDKLHNLAGKAWNTVIYSVGSGVLQLRGNNKIFLFLRRMFCTRTSAISYFLWTKQRHSGSETLYFLLCESVSYFMWCLRGDASPKWVHVLQRKGCHWTPLCIPRDNHEFKRTD